jgi:hypothetical protein
MNRFTTKNAFIISSSKGGIEISLFTERLCRRIGGLHK